MNKSELIESIAKKAGLTKDAAAKAVNAYTETVIETLKAGGPHCAQSPHPRGNQDPRDEGPRFQGWQDAEGQCKVITFCPAN